LIQEIIGRPVKAAGSLVKSIYSKGVEDAVVVEETNKYPKNDKKTFDKNKNKK
jgi:ABC-type hemin transport system substrate-binding protein